MSFTYQFAGSIKLESWEPFSFNATKYLEMLLVRSRLPPTNIFSSERTAMAFNEPLNFKML